MNSKIIEITSGKLNLLLSGEFVSLLSPDDRVKGFLKGRIYNSTTDKLIEDFIQFGKTFIERQDGSFLIVIVDNREANSESTLIFTDRVNSFKVFYGLKDDNWLVSDNIDSFDKSQFHISRKSIACFLANGNLLNGLTLFGEINMSEGSSIYSFRNNMFRAEKYWRILFDYKSQVTALEEEIFKSDLKKILESSVECRLRAMRNKVIISLSAGYDARSILGLVKKVNPMIEVDTFTYRPTLEIFKNSDAEISFEISKEYANFHHGLKSYNGFFIQTLIENANEGKCLTNFCDEIDAINDLRKLNKYSDVFTGDEWFGRLNVPLNTNVELLDSVSIVGSWGIDWLKNILRDETYETFVKDLDNLTNEIIQDTERFVNLHDKKDYLYLHQRVSNVNLVWREYFTSKIGFVHNPYLSNELLDFYQKVPPKLRIEKKLFIETITELLPNIFLYPISDDRRSLSGINYKEEIVKNRAEIIELINDSNSYLEELITKQEVINAIILLAIEKDSFLKFFSKKVLKIVNFLRRIFKPFDYLFNIFLGPRIVKRPSHEKVVVRLLLLWIYLIKPKEQI